MSKVAKLSRDRGRAILSRLEKITKQLSSAESLQDAIEILAKDGCLDSNHARCFLGWRLENSLITRIADSGFSIGSQNLQTYGGLFDPNIINQSVDSRVPRIVLHDRDYQTRFKSFMAVQDESDWEVTAIICLDSQLILFISSKSKTFTMVDSMKYLTALAAVLNLFLKSRGVDRQLSRKAKRGKAENLRGVDLSERQSLILKKIREGSTNSQIADWLGYSESLIRQETIAIYQKLGVDGRVDLEIIRGVQDPEN